MLIFRRRRAYNSFPGATIPRQVLPKLSAPDFRPGMVVVIPAGPGKRDGSFVRYKSALEYTVFSINKNRLYFCAFGRCTYSVALI